MTSCVLCRKPKRKLSAKRHFRALFVQLCLQLRTEKGLMYGGCFAGSYRKRSKPDRIAYCLISFWSKGYIEAARKSLVFVDKAMVEKGPVLVPGIPNWVDPLGIGAEQAQILKSASCSPPSSIKGSIPQTCCTPKTGMCNKNSITRSHCAEETNSKEMVHLLRERL